jgi:hypothetical protein
MSRRWLKMLRYLEANGFATYIASVGDRDFMRPVAEDRYGSPPERIIGCSLGITYSSEGGQSALHTRAASAVWSGTSPIDHVMANNGARSRSAALNADPTDDRSSASLRHERLTGHVGLN